MSNRDTLLYIAEIIDAYRVVPRIILAAYGFFIWYVVNWYLPIANPTTGQTALVTTVAGSIPVVVGLYQNSGRRWGSQGNRQMFPNRGSRNAPTIVLPPVSPNINIGNNDQPNVNPPGRSAGPYSDKDWED